MEYHLGMALEKVSNKNKKNASLVRGVSVAGLPLSLREEEGGRGYYYINCFKS